MSDRTSEGELVIALRRREQWAITELYARYSSMLSSLIRRIVRDEAHAEDLLQEVFMKIWHRFDQYDESRGALSTWLVSIARSTAIDAVRSRSYRNTMNNRPFESAFDLVETATSTAMQVDGIGLGNLVKRLRPEHRAVVHKIYYEGLTHEEAARELSMPLGTVKTRLRAALRKLREVEIPAWA